MDENLSFEIVLSRNDIGETGAHQAGILVPKSKVALGVLPILDEKKKNPWNKVDFFDEEGNIWIFKYIHYNNKKIENGTRDEYRLTGMTEFLREKKLTAGDSVVVIKDNGQYLIRYTRKELEMIADNEYEKVISVQVDDNESEEDIQNLAKLDLSDIAVTGTDWTVETIVNQINKGNIVLDPSFQRRDAWSNKTKSRFIESLFLGLPIPQVILAEQKEKKGKFIVIDGKQRLLSLKQFVKPDIGEKVLQLSGLEVLTKFNKHTYADINEDLYYDEIDAFNNHTIRTVVIKNWKKVEVLYLMFLRLNTGSVKLSPQELRQALYPGPFINYVNDESSRNESLQKMLKIKKPDFRMRDVEILIRYFAFHYFSDKYAGSMQNFLDYACNQLNKTFEHNKSNIASVMQNFNDAVEIVFEIFSEKGAFKKYKSGKYEDRYNRAVIDIMLYYFSQLLQKKEVAIENKEKIKECFERLCDEDPEFISAIESTTKSLTSVHYRFKVWGAILSTVLNCEVKSPKGFE